MTIKEIIEQVDDIKPNAFSEKTKLTWIAELDGSIASDVMMMNIVEVQQLQYRHPTDLESTPLVSFPHDGIYVLWLRAKIDEANGEAERYENSMAQYNASYGKFVRWFAATHEPAQGYARGMDASPLENPPYYITAYGLAVKRGFKGTIDEWIASLKGETGAGAKLRYNAQTGCVEWAGEDTEDWQELFVLEELADDVNAALKAQLDAAVTAAKGSANDAAAAATSVQAAVQAVGEAAGAAGSAAAAAAQSVNMAQAGKTGAEKAQAAAEAAAKNAGESAAAARNSEAAARGHAKTAADAAERAEEAAAGASAGRIDEAIADHETNLAAHADIRNTLEALRNRVNAALNSDDVTLDQLAEIVAYIKSNKTLIDAITTSKVSVADIVDNLATNVASKPLSAARGVELNRLIGALETSLGNYQPKGNYLTEHQDISHLLPRGELPGAVEEHLETEGLPGYWLEHLALKVPAINTAMELAGKSKSAFYFYTDAHRISSAGRTPDLLRYLYRQTGINKTNSGGDFFEPFAEGADALARMREHMAELWGLPNHHSVIGNHDEDNEALTSGQQLYGFYLAWEESNDIVWGGYHYYYIDNRAECTRYLYLDTGKFAVSDDEMQFVIDALTTAPEGWHIVAISHIWYDYQISAIPDYAQHLLDVFDACNLRTAGAITHNGAEFVYDFTKVLGTVAFCIGGHVHWDAVLHSVKGIPVILTDSDSYYSRSGIDAAEGTTGECCFDAVVADYDAGTVKLIRIGRGADRLIPLPSDAPDEPDVPAPTYTNQLPISTDDDGNVYNGVGYKAGVRYSASNRSEVETEGSYLSGRIDVGWSDTVYLKNIQLNSGGESVANNVVFISEAGTNAFARTVAQLVADHSGVLDENGNVVQFSVANSTGGCIRINASYIGKDSVVTVNEPIA